MGYKAMEWVWDNYEGRGGSDKLVLLRIAYYVNDKTGIGFPSVDTISKKVNRSTRQVQSVIKSLRGYGVILVDEGGGRLSNTYHLLGYIATLPGQSLHPSHEAQFTSDVSNVVQIHTGYTKSTSSQPRNSHHPSHEMGNTSATKPNSPEHTYNNNTNTIEEQKPIKSNVIPVGDDTAQNHFPESTQTPQPTPTGNVTMSQPSKPTGMTDQSQTPVMEGVATSLDTTQLNSVPTNKNAPPIVPPADAPKVRSLNNQQVMVSAIAKVFGWDFVTLTKSNKKLVGKVASELREVGATPDDIPVLYAYCKNQNWSGKFTPMALSSQWANFVAEKASKSASNDYLVDEMGMIWRTYIPPPDYKPIFDYDAMNCNFEDAIGTDDCTPTIEYDPNMTGEELMKKAVGFIMKSALQRDITPIELDPNDPLNEEIPW